MLHIPRAYAIGRVSSSRAFAPVGVIGIGLHMDQYKEPSTIISQAVWVLGGPARALACTDRHACPTPNWDGELLARGRYRVRPSSGCWTTIPPGKPARAIVLLAAPRSRLRLTSLDDRMPRCWHARCPHQMLAPDRETADRNAGTPWLATSSPSGRKPPSPRGASRPRTPITARQAGRRRLGPGRLPCRPPASTGLQASEPFQQSRARHPYLLVLSAITPSPT